MGVENFIIISVYRPPYSTTLEEFYKELQNILEIIISENKLAFIAGDFNIDFKDHKNIVRVNFLLNSYSFDLTFSESTRVTATSSTCIDNIITNFKKVFTTHILYTAISDHLGLKLSFSLRGGVSPVTSYKRFYTSENINICISKLVEQDWSDVYDVEEDEVNSQWNCFIGLFLRLFQECFPLRLVTSRKHRRNEVCDLDVDNYRNKLSALQLVQQFCPEAKNIYHAFKREYNNLLARKRSEIYRFKFYSI